MSTSPFFSLIFYRQFGFNLSTKIVALQFFINDTVLPKYTVSPILVFNEFRIYGDPKVTGTDFVGNRIVVNEVSNKHTEAKTVVYETSSYEYFFIKNMRSSKQLDMIGSYVPQNYTPFAISSEALSLVETKISTEKNFFRFTKPLTEAAISMNKRPREGAQYSNLGKILNSDEIAGSSLVETKFHKVTSEPISGSTLSESKLSYPNDALAKQTPQEVSRFIKSYLPEVGSENLTEVNCRHMIGKIIVTIKGVDIEIVNVHDKLVEDSKKTPGITVASPLDRLLSEKIWSHINPNPVSILDMSNQIVNLATEETTQAKEKNYQEQEIMRLIHSNIYAQASYDEAAQFYTKQKDSAIKVFANGNLIDFNQYDGVVPVVSNGRTLMPIRALSESLGATVDWNPSLERITIVLEGHKIELGLNSSKAYVDGILKTLDVPATSFNGRVMVPMRFIGENFHKMVDWHAQVGDGGVISILAQ